MTQPPTFYTQPWPSHSLYSCTKNHPGYTWGRVWVTKLCLNELLRENSACFLFRCNPITSWPWHNGVQQQCCLKFLFVQTQKKPYISLHCPTFEWKYYSAGGVEQAVALLSSSLSPLSGDWHFPLCAPNTNFTDLTAVKYNGVTHAPPNCDTHSGLNNHPMFCSLCGNVANGTPVKQTLIQCATSWMIHNNDMTYRNTTGGCPPSTQFSGEWQEAHSMQLYVYSHPSCSWSCIQSHQWPSSWCTVTCQIHSLPII